MRTGAYDHGWLWYWMGDLRVVATGVIHGWRSRGLEVSPVATVPGPPTLWLDMVGLLLIMVDQLDDDRGYPYDLRVCTASIEIFHGIRSCELTCQLDLWQHVQLQKNVAMG